MDNFIKENSRLNDINSKDARENLDFMVDYLCSSVAPDTIPALTKLEGITLEECHEIIAKTLYNRKNAILASVILKTRSLISDGDVIDGFSAIYDLTRKYLVEISSRCFFESVASFEHEMIHILPALNGNNPDKQYNEILSIFGEFLTLEILSEKFNNPDIFINNLIRRCIKRMSFRVYGSYFVDEEIEQTSDYLKKAYLSAYDYMIGFIYALRLFEIYHQDNTRVLTDFNLVLSGKKSVGSLIQEYNISLVDTDTITCFMKTIDSYREYVSIKYGEEVHRVN